MLDGLYQYRLGSMWVVLYRYRLGNVGLGCIDIGYVMLDGLYQYRLGNVGWAVSI